MVKSLVSRSNERLPRAARNVVEALLLAVPLWACADARVTATRDMLAFAASEPFSIGSAKNRYSGYSVVVDDSALSAFNHVFRYLDVPDSARASVYAELPGQLLWALPVDDIASSSIRAIGGDTALVTTPFERPASALYTEAIEHLLHTGDTMPPGSAARAEFRHALQRLRNELRETDTAFFWVRPGPRIVRWRTASGIRDSIALDSTVRVARADLNRLVDAAKFSGLALSDYSDLQRFGSELPGGAVRGTVDPGEAGWYENAAERAFYDGVIQVQCEARRAGTATRATGYIVVDSLLPNQRKDFACVWNNADEWTRIRPNTFRVRLFLALFADSVVGPWVVFGR